MLPAKQHSQQEPYILKKGNNIYIRLGPLFHIKNATCWLEGDNYKHNASWSQENLCGFSRWVTNSAQMQSCSACVTLKHLLTEAHLRCPISNMPKKRPVLCAEHSAAGRLELQESPPRCLRSPKVFSLKFTEILLSKDSALGLLLRCLLWRLIFGLPASVLCKNLQM